MRYIQNKITWFREQSKIKKILILGLIAAVLYFGYKSNFSNKDDVSYKYDKAIIGDITQTVSETGEITTSNKTEVASTITGIVTKNYVNNGEVVKRGAKLFEVVSTATEAERATTWSAYQSAKATLEQARATQYSLQASMFTEWDQFKELAESDDYEEEDGSPRADQRNLPEYHAPEKEWLAAEADYKSQDQVIAKAQSALNNAWLNYQATIDGSVKATADGVVQNLSIAEGQKVSSQQNALIIESESQTWVQTAINENDIINIKPGQNAEVVIDALLGKSLPATVQRVDEFGTDISDVMIYYVYLTLEETDDSIRPGMTTQVDIITQQKSDVVLIPNTAIKPYDGNKAVEIMDPATKTVLYQPIVRGVMGDTYTEVISGLEEGDVFIVSSNDSDNKPSGGLKVMKR